MAEGRRRGTSGAAIRIGSGTERVGTGRAPASPARPHPTAVIGFQNRGRLFIAGEARCRFPFRSSPQARPTVPAPAAVRGRLACSLGWRGWGLLRGGEASPTLPRIHPPVQTQAATPYLSLASQGSAAVPLQLPCPPPYPRGTAQDQLPAESPARPNSSYAEPRPRPHLRAPGKQGEIRDLPEPSGLQGMGKRGAGAAPPP